jgi:type II secretory pathway component PulF
MTLPEPRNSWGRDESVEKPARRAWYAQKLSGADATELMAQIALLSQRGLPLPGGLRALAEELGDNRLRQALLELATHLDAGRSIVEALDDGNLALPPPERAVLVAAIRSGAFAEVIEEYVATRVRAREAARKLRNLLAYPALLAIVSMIFLVIIEQFVVSQFRTIYEDFDADLPAMTHVVLAVSSGISYFFVGVLGAMLVVYLLVLLGGGAAFRRRLAYRLPLVGRIWKYSLLSQFSRMAGLLVKYSVPLPDALHLAAASTGDPDLRRSIALVAQDLIAGKDLGARLAADARLPAGLAQLVTWGEDRHALAESLELAGEMFDARTHGQFTFASIIGPPIGLALVVFLFGFIVVTLMLPLIGLIEKLA